MDKRQITIMGHEVTIAYNMATQIAYEEITGTAFDTTAFDKTGNMLTLFYSCIVANNPDTKLTFDDLLMKAKASDINTLRDAVIESFTDWCKSVVGDEKPKEETGEKKS